jgi:ubiquinol-cytochrome c reductase iron-sulfur subunit
MLSRSGIIKAAASLLNKPTSQTISSAFGSSLARKSSNKNSFVNKNQNSLINAIQKRQASGGVNFPDMGDYRREGSAESRRAFTYFVVGAAGVGLASTAKNLVSEFLSTMGASADVLAMANVEVDLSTLAEGQTVIVKWRGKPLFIRHRTAEEIESANDVNMAELRDPETDASRAKNPEYLILLGICTHLGCVPLNGQGEYGGWFCPCHGSHYDISGRIRKGPAPKNLEVPPYVYLDDSKVVIGTSEI